MANILLNDPLVKEALFWLGRTWFLWAPVGLFLLFRDVWLRYIRTLTIFGRNYILLEIKIPREVAKSPKAMESILAGIYGTGRLGNLVERYWEGWVSGWFSLELIGDGGEIHFYIWTHDFFRQMLEAQIYAQYPSSEIRVVEDYVANMPRALPNDEWTLWGTEFIHTRPDAYPIRTYEDFNLEDISAKEEERKIDPLSSLFEFLGQLKQGEKIWIQILVRPADDRWRKEGEALVGKLVGKTIKAQPSFITQVVDALHGALMAVVSAPAEKPKKEKKEADQFKMLNLSPGERATVEAVERNISKIGFETGIRWMYLARRDTFNFLAVPAILGIFKQFSSQSLNGFKPNKKTSTSVDYFFKNYRDNKRKSRLYNAYRLRSIFFPPYKRRSKTIVLASSELATIYHFPGMVVASPATPRIEAKRGAPPPNLPI